MEDEIMDYCRVYKKEVKSKLVQNVLPGDKCQNFRDFESCGEISQLPKKQTLGKIFSERKISKLFNYFRLREKI